MTNTHDERRAEVERMKTAILWLAARATSAERALADERAKVARLHEENARLHAEVGAGHEHVEAALDRVEEALGGHPECDVHPDDDPVSCGWKRAVMDARAALAGPELETTE